MSRQTVCMIVQCALSCVIGCAAYWFSLPSTNPKAPLAAGLICGFAGGWAVMFLYVWIRHGWKAARSMSLTP